MKEDPVRAGETERLGIGSAFNKGLRASLVQREWEAEVSMGGKMEM